MKRNRIRFIVGFITCIFSISVVSNGIKKAQEQGENRIGPWQLLCHDRKFPTRAIARDYFGQKPFDIQFCVAEQATHYQGFDEEITALLHITPARIFFEIRNFLDKKRNSLLIVGDRHFALYANCYVQDQQPVCSLYPHNKIENVAIVKAMSHHKKATLRVTDERFSDPLQFHFDLDSFQDVYPLVEDTYKQMKEMFE